MENDKSEFSEIVAEMSQFTGAAVVAGKKLIRYVNDLTIVDTILKPPAAKKQKSEIKSSKNTEVD